MIIALYLVEFSLIPLQHQNPPSPLVGTLLELDQAGHGWAEFLSYRLREVPGLFTSDAYLCFVTWCTKWTCSESIRLSGWNHQLKNRPWRTKPSLNDTCLSFSKHLLQPLFLKILPLIMHSTGQFQPYFLDISKVGHVLQWLSFANSWCHSFGTSVD